MCRMGSHDLCRVVFLAHVGERYIKTRCECPHHPEKPEKGRGR